MAQNGEEIHIDEQDAKAGRKGTHVFVILIVSLVLAVAVFAASMFFGTSKTENAAPPMATESAAPAQTGPSPTT